MRRFSQLAMPTLLFAALVSQVQPSRAAAAYYDDCANESSTDGSRDEAVADYDIAMTSVWSREPCCSSNSPYPCECS
jgi:hypothetical protein